MIEEINTKLKEVLGINQWKNTGSAIDWLRNIKQNCVFIQVDFYLSITETILNKVLNLAYKYINIINNQWKILQHNRKFFLFDNETSGIKNDKKYTFDVTTIALKLVSQ